MQLFMSGPKYAAVFFVASDRTATGNHVAAGESMSESSHGASRLHAPTAICRFMINTIIRREFYIFRLIETLLKILGEHCGPIRLKPA